MDVETTLHADLLFGYRRPMMTRRRDLDDITDSARMRRDVGLRDLVAAPPLRIQGLWPVGGR